MKIQDPILDEYNDTFIQVGVDRDATDGDRICALEDKVAHLEARVSKLINNQKIMYTSTHELIRSWNTFQNIVQFLLWIGKIASVIALLYAIVKPTGKL